ncbi:hypothetical protein [Geomonas terrae]|uniref:hypothetical protein n=1 Tax=Geomonas terrae TaxID=2562681 RepID=UPI0010920626|nr:hypothetical protein [Geomonas terrae]
MPFAVMILADVLTGHRTLFYVCSDLGLRPQEIFQSPSKKYDVSELGFGWSGGTLSISAVRKFKIFPEEILRIETQNTGIEARGPEKIDFGLAWSEDESKVALIYCGWYVDFYDFDNSESYRFKFPFLQHASSGWLAEHSQRVIALLGTGYVKQQRSPYF